MSPRLLDGLVNFATFFVPAVLIALADRVPRRGGGGGAGGGGVEATEGR